MDRNTVSCGCYVWLFITRMWETWLGRIPAPTKTRVSDPLYKTHGQPDWSLERLHLNQQIDYKAILPCQFVWQHLEFVFTSLEPVKFMCHPLGLGVWTLNEERHECPLSYADSECSLLKNVCKAKVTCNMTQWMWTKSFVCPTPKGTMVHFDLCVFNLLIWLLVPHWVGILQLLYPVPR
jgi:hypothetical protein